jgi:Domain of unknown function (DUF4157)
MKTSKVNKNQSQTLTIGSTNDPQEQQADQTADNIMRMPESPFVQRKCASCEHEEEKINRKTESFIQKQGNGSEGGTASESVTNQINSSRGGGSRMSENTLSFMESRFNTDFSGVKIHTDTNAVQMSRELNAQAFTVGRDIYFNSGKYSPESASGKHLLAHELTHTVQQGGGVDRKIQKKCGSEIGQPSGCIHSETIPLGNRYLFQVNCDEFQTGNLQDLINDSQQIQQGETVELHGIASIDGDAEFNENLSCARALKAKQVVESVLRSRNVSATILNYNHGGNLGTAYLQRSVVLKRISAPTPIPPHQVPRITPTPIPIPPVLKFWINAFIPTGLIPSAIRASAGPYSGREVFPGPPHPGSPPPGSIIPFHTNGCFETDDRGFSNALPHPSSRVHLLMEFDTTTHSLSASSGVFGGFTFEIDCTSGAVLCTSPVSPSGLGVGLNHIPFTNTYIINFGTSANDPCVTASPNLATRGIISIDLDTRTFSYNTFSTFFPSFEMYFNDGTSTLTLYRESAHSATPFALLVPGLNPLSGSGSF